MLFDRVLFALQDTVFNFAINLNLILADFQSFKIEYQVDKHQHIFDTFLIEFNRKAAIQ